MLVQSCDAAADGLCTIWPSSGPDAAQGCHRDSVHWLMVLDGSSDSRSTRDRRRPSEIGLGERPALAEKPRRRRPDVVEYPIDTSSGLRPCSRPRTYGRDGSKLLTIGHMRRCVGTEHENCDSTQRPVNASVEATTPLPTTAAGISATLKSPWTTRPLLHNASEGPFTM